MKLFKSAHVYAPQYLGQKDVLIAGDKIIAVEDNINLIASSFVEVIQTDGLILTPGFVDSLVHITGGGGEGGYTTRTPEMHINEAIKGGVTTVIGVLGTDAQTRSLENLLAKAYALEEQGISVYCYTGSYHYPMVTVTQSMKHDIMLIEKFIGVGEVAIADHRSSQLTAHEMARLTSEARVAGMLAGKAGIVSVHLGDENSRLDLLYDVIAQFDIPITQYYPTHINRSRALFEAGIEFTTKGGYIDFTTSTTAQIIEQGEIPAAQALALALKQGVPVHQITMSSDGNASLPVFDHLGKLIDLQVGQVCSLHQAMVDAVKQFDVSIEDALTSITLSPASILQLKAKGCIAAGLDADINLLNAHTLAIEAVYSKGERVYCDGVSQLKIPF
ncbi:MULTISPECIES: beta-aspartyl-peptidase [Shewanella]|uniref:beta-aspartyl-peptidase n=1 Tax=Shewanella TaxID=22 RepID=UPI000F50F2A9|nr:MULTISPECIES: beta-aspartyl-peptidase [Shewanella]MBB1321868.1 beta-aspartyl-peptidase [Shewanella sp. SR43-8]MBB1390506.1 beta-aspartyl-peptidase [Shewanella sp. SG44-6]RPA55474.1 beta-aspartyl-peptidase [Shewanella vesiculosa]UJL43490.1 beta-aspartyl-peptidase [Shewanella vesiculosa]|tara:strand:+ start:333 stop:1496 length:1164 start_codon:yes stop_codon:yes gene_type:complete